MSYSSSISSSNISYNYNNINEISISKNIRCEELKKQYTICYKKHSDFQGQCAYKNDDENLCVLNILKIALEILLNDCLDYINDNSHDENSLDNVEITEIASSLLELQENLDEKSKEFIRSNVSFEAEQDVGEYFEKLQPHCVSKARTITNPYQSNYHILKSDLDSLYCRYNEFLEEHTRKKFMIIDFKHLNYLKQDVEELNIECQKDQGLEKDEKLNLCVSLSTLQEDIDELWQKINKIPPTLNLPSDSANNTSPKYSQQDDNTTTTTSTYCNSPSNDINHEIDNQSLSYDEYVTELDLAIAESLKFSDREGNIDSFHSHYPEIFESKIKSNTVGKDKQYVEQVSCHSTEKIKFDFPSVYEELNHSFLSLKNSNKYLKSVLNFAQDFLKELKCLQISVEEAIQKFSTYEITDELKNSFILLNENIKYEINDVENSHIIENNRFSHYRTSF